jgi:hypothetical protein
MLMKTSRREVISRACDQNFVVVLRKMKAGRAISATLLRCVGVAAT